MVHRNRLDTQQGFTLIELLVATTVFSVILLLLTQGLIQVTRFYLKGDTIVRTQDAAQSTLSAISNAIQFSGGAITPTSAKPNVFCVNNNRFTYQLDKELTEGAPSGDKANVVIVVDQPTGGCNASTPPQSLVSYSALSAGSKELLGSNMRLNNLSVTALDSAQTIWQVSVGVVYGDKEVINPAHNGCSFSVRDGGQFCASSQLTTIVQKRVQ